MTSMEVTQRAISEPPDEGEDSNHPVLVAPVLIVNQGSGGSISEDHRERCHQLGVQIIDLGEDDDLVVAAMEALAEGADCLGVAGGDGSLNAGAQVAISHDVPFVCVPAGTRNHFARDLGLDRNDPHHALSAFESGVERLVDVAFANQLLFVNNISIGVYGEIVHDDAYRDHKWSTVVGIVPALLHGQREIESYTLRAPDGTMIDSAFMVLIGNNRYALDTLAGFGCRERLDQGILQIAVCEIERYRDLAGVLAAIAAGDPDSATAFRQWESTDLTIEGEESLKVGVDGEALTLELPLRIHSQPGALRVLIPRSLSD